MNAIITSYHDAASVRWFYRLEFASGRRLSAAAPGPITATTATDDVLAHFAYDWTDDASHDGEYIHASTRSPVPPTER